MATPQHPRPDAGAWRSDRPHAGCTYPVPASLGHPPWPGPPVQRPKTLLHGSGAFAEVGSRCSRMLPASLRAAADFFNPIRPCAAPGRANLPPAAAGCKRQRGKRLPGAQEAPKFSYLAPKLSQVDPTPRCWWRHRVTRRPSASWCVCRRAINPARYCVISSTRRRVAQAPGF